MTTNIFVTNRPLGIFQKCGLLLFLVVIPFSLNAFDWGLLADQSGTVEGTGTKATINDVKDSLEYSGTLIPWLSSPLGDTADLYISASAAAYYKTEEWLLVPELLRTQATFRIKEDGELKIGRMNYADPLGIIADGLFDGVQYSWDFIKAGTISIGAWYTGFQYKKNAHITMTEEELDSYNEELDYADFAGTYFAPRRAFMAINWEYFGLGKRTSLNCAFIGQFDLSGKEEAYHSSYLMAKLTVPVKSFIIEPGGCAELAMASQRYYFSFAGELGISWMPPTTIQDRLMFLGRFTNGSMLDKSIAALVPITTVPQGKVLRAKLSGISTLGLDYTARLHKTFSVQLTSTYFVLSDLNTYESPFNNDKGNYFLGNEFYASFIWSPLSDLQINLGGGAFLPSLGNVDKNGDLLWCAELAVKLALF